MAEQAAARFQELAQAKGKVEEAAVTAVYDALPPTTPEFLIGSWKGYSFDTGHPAHQKLLGLNWAGKDFISTEDVNPVMVYGKDGERTPSPPFGKARIRQVVFRGQVSAAMIYDSLPIIDSFKQVNKDVVLGAMDSRDANPAGTYFFYLARNGGEVSRL